MKTQRFGERSFEYCSFTKNCTVKRNFGLKRFLARKIQNILFFSTDVSFY